MAMMILQKKGWLIQRAADGWESPRFQAGFWLKIGSDKIALSPPAHTQVTQTVSRAQGSEG